MVGFRDSSISSRTMAERSPQLARKIKPRSRHIHLERFGEAPHGSFQPTAPELSPITASHRSACERKCTWAAARRWIASWALAVSGASFITGWVS